MSPTRTTAPGWVLPTAAAAVIAGLLLSVVSIPLAIVAWTLAIAGVVADIHNTLGGGPR